MCGSLGGVVSRSVFAGTVGVDGAGVWCMESYQRESLSSGEMVKAARRQVLGRGGMTVSEEMVAAAHDRVSAMGADSVAKHPVSGTAAVVWPNISVWFL